MSYPVMATRPPGKPVWVLNRPYCAYLARVERWRADLEAWRAARGARALVDAFTAGLSALVESHP